MVAAPPSSISKAAGAAELSEENPLPRVSLLLATVTEGHWSYQKKKKSHRLLFNIGRESLSN